MQASPKRVTPRVFDQALSDPKVNEIRITGAIPLSDTLTVDRPVTITGGELTFSGTGKNLVFLNGGTVKGTTIRNTSEVQKSSRSRSKSAEPVWTSTYGLQVYKGSAVIEDCTFIGGNAALLVNGSNVTLKGKTTISGMSFGGIEVSKGVEVETPGILNIEGDLVNENEAYGKPTVWVDGTTTDIGQVNDTKSQLTMAVIKEQNQYYLNPENTTDPSLETESTPVTTPEVESPGDTSET